MNSLTTIKYWEETQGLPNINLDENNVIKKWIDKYVDFSSIKSVIEIGCYPGRYLSIFANHSIPVSGIDHIKAVNMLPSLFEKNGFKTGKFYCDEFLSAKIDENYDCVVSLGFLEHFKNWEDIFSKHIQLLNNNGLLIIEVPNFSGWMQWFPRILFDRENLRRHNIKSMNIVKWLEILRSHNFEIIYSGYFGGYMLWYEKKYSSRLMVLLRLLIERLLLIIKKIIYGNKENHVAFSGAMGIIARKK